MKKRKFFMPTWDKPLAQVILDKGHTLTLEGEDYDCAIFSGFTPVCPFLYGENTILKDKPDLARDRIEWHHLRNMPTKRPKIGLCRGAELLNVFNGGSSWQEVYGHQILGGHELEVLGSMVKVHSWHKQLMIPTRHARIIGVASVSKSVASAGLCVDYSPHLRKPIDPEIVHYNHTNSLCFQPEITNEKFTYDAPELFWLCVEHLLFPAKAGSALTI